MFRSTLLIVLLLCTPVHALPPEPPARYPDFQAWLVGLRMEALARGITQQTLATALDGLQPIEVVIERDRRQPEFVRTFLDYLGRAVTPERVELGSKLLQQHRDALERISTQYGVPPNVLVAFWGLETNFGKYMGRYPVIGVLATLAYDDRRSAFFRAELLDALAILQEGHIALDQMLGSWAGAMGQVQFMPSTFRRHAVDGDGDGRKDIWNSLPDAFASAANFLNRLGWQAAQPWGQEVLLPKGFDLRLAGAGARKSLDDWVALGVRRADGRDLPGGAIDAALLLPQGHQGPAFLVYRNFGVILGWNRSNNYALAVGHLADRMMGLPPLLTGQGADNRVMSREQIVDMQQLLNDLGFALGEADGVPGSRTRAAIRAFQNRVGLPVDGYPSPALLERLWVETGKTGLEPEEAPAAQPEAGVSARLSGRAPT